MENKRKSYQIIFVIGVLLCIFAIVWKFCFAGEKEAVQSPENPKEKLQISVQNIEAVQFDGMIADASQMDEKKFVELLSEVTPLSEGDTPELGEQEYIVTIHGEEQSKESFYFYQDAETDGKWYVKTEDDQIFENAEFITEYIGISPGDYLSEGKLEIPDATAFGQMITLHQRLKELGAAYSASDLRALLTIEIQNQKALCDTEEEAVQMAKEYLAKKMAQYEYAVRQGDLLSDEELEARILKEDAVVKEAAGFSELEQCLEQYGTTYDEYQQERKEYRRIQFTIANLYEKVYDEFRHGNIWIGDRQAKDINEYWTYYLTDVVFPETETYMDEVLKPLLDEAETFYQTYLK